MFLNYNNASFYEFPHSYLNEIFALVFNFIISGSNVDN